MVPWKRKKETLFSHLIIFGVFHFTVRAEVAKERKQAHKAEVEKKKAADIESKTAEQWSIGAKKDRKVEAEEKRVSKLEFHTYTLCETKKIKYIYYIVFDIRN